MSQRVTDVTASCVRLDPLACKIGVVLDQIEAVRLMGILASTECLQRLSKATGKKE